MRAALATVLIVSVCSCHHLSQPSKEASADTPGPNRIAVGDAMEDVAQQIVAAGGKNINWCIGVIDYPMSSWFILKDGTYLQVKPAVTSETGREVVGHLTIGKPGRGYGEVGQWTRQSREVGSVDLR